MPTDLQSILKIEVPVIVLIASHHLKVDEVRHLAPGAIIELPKTTDDDLEILINNQGIALGRAVKVGENFGVRVTRVGDLTQRIEALGVGDSSDETTESEAEPAETEEPEALADEVLAQSQG